jgi:hypothetical protein
MKPLTILLGIIAVLLFFILGKLGQMQAALEGAGPNAQSIVASNQALIGTMQKLENSFDSLRQEISDFKEKMLKK